MTAIVKDPKKLEAFVVYVQSIARRQFPHDEVTLTLNGDNTIAYSIRVVSSEEHSRVRRACEIRAFLQGVMSAPTLLSKADMQCAVYLAQPFQPASKLPD